MWLGRQARSHPPRHESGADDMHPRMNGRATCAIVVCVAAAAATAASSQSQAPRRYTSAVFVHDVAAGSSTLVYRAEGVWEAPNWSRDGKYLLLNSGGRLYRLFT